MEKWFQNKNFPAKKGKRGTNARKAHRDINARKVRRALGVLLAAALVFQTLPFGSAAASASEVRGGLCEHHRSHTPDCGYTEAEPGAECTHEHTEDCYKTVEDCIHGHTESCYPADTATDSEGALSSLQNAATPAVKRAAVSQRNWTAGMSMTVPADTRRKRREAPALLYVKSVIAGHRRMTGMHLKPVGK